MQSRRDEAPASSTLLREIERDVGLLMCRCGFSLSFLPCKLLAGLAFAFRLGMATGSQLQVGQREKCKDKGLHYGHEDFKRDEDDIGQKWQDEGEDRQHHAASEDVAEKTESQRDDAGNFTDDLQQADEEFDEAGQAEREQRLEVQVLADVLAE